MESFIDAVALPDNLNLSCDLGGSERGYRNVVHHSRMAGYFGMKKTLFNFKLRFW